MTQVPRVSVIIPNYNKEKTLAVCLSAVFAQTHRPAEVIVVDDASTDGSREIARRFPCRLITFPVNRGPSAARNAGAADCTGNVLFFVDSDIALEETAIENALRVLRADPSIGVVQGIYDKVPLFDDGPVETYKTLFEHYWRRRGAGIAPVTLFALTALPTEVFQRVGGFDESMRDAEDIEFGSHLPARYQIWTSERMLGRHDEVDRFWPWLTEQVRRALRHGIAMVEAHGAGSRTGRGDHRRSLRTKAVSPASLASCVLAVASLPLAVLSAWLLSAWLLAVPAVLYATFLFLNRDLNRFVVRERGPAFVVFFTAMHTVRHLTSVFIGLGALYALARRYAR